MSFSQHSPVRGRSRSPALVSLVALGVLALCAPARAQTTLYVSAGPSFPVGAWEKVTKTGWILAGGALFGVGSSGFGIKVDLVYGQNGGEQVLFEDPKWSVFSVAAIAEYAFGSPGKLRPYLIGGLGFGGHRFSAREVDPETKTDFVYKLGAGLDVPIGGTTSLFAEGRYVGSGNEIDTQFLAVLLGLAFTLGGD